MELDAPADAEFEKVLDDLGPRDTVRPEGLKTFRLDRRAEVTLSLDEGRHVVHPFGIEFILAGDGALATDDARLRVSTKAGRVEVLCHPVTVKTFSQNRSVAGPLRLACGPVSLLEGLDSLIAEFSSKNKVAAGVSPQGGFLRLTLYLPASTRENPYTVNDVRFDVAADGSVTVIEDTRARCPDGREIRLQRPGKATVKTQRLGVRWFGASGEVKLACGPAAAGGEGTSGSAWLPVPVTGSRTLRLGKRAVRLPDIDPRWPQALLLWDVAGYSGVGFRVTRSLR